jgi:hypothetical protein
MYRFRISRLRKKLKRYSSGNLQQERSIFIKKLTKVSSLSKHSVTNKPEHLVDVDSLASEESLQQLQQAVPTLYYIFQKLLMKRDTSRAVLARMEILGEAMQRVRSKARGKESKAQVIYRCSHPGCPQIFKLKADLTKHMRSMCQFKPTSEPRRRVCFTKEQLALMEREFDRNPDVKRGAWSMERCDEVCVKFREAGLTSPEKNGKNVMEWMFARRRKRKMEVEQIMGGQELAKRMMLENG